MLWVFNWAVTGSIDLTESVLNKEGEHRLNTTNSFRRRARTRRGEFEMLGNGMEQNILIDVTSVKYLV